MRSPEEKCGLVMGARKWGTGAATWQAPQKASEFSSNRLACGGTGKGLSETETNSWRITDVEWRDRVPWRHPPARTHQAPHPVGGGGLPDVDLRALSRRHSLRGARFHRQPVEHGLQDARPPRRLS